MGKWIQQHACLKKRIQQRHHGSSNASENTSFNNNSKLGRLETNTQENCGET
jgi:hypothetical protein